MSIQANLEQVKDTFINPACLLVAVSKTKPVSAIEEAYAAGIRDFGENKVQELTEKQALLPEDIRWHMIGHLQRNKVKFIAPFVHLIHGVDTFKLLLEINKQAEKANRKISCLLQVHIATEDTKFGFSPEELLDLVQSSAYAELNHIQVRGLMGMATNTENQERVKAEFASLKKLLAEMNRLSLPSNTQMDELSMGMSGDYLLAQEEGSTMVRIGSAIFGNRNYR
ncbi:YggS family pyridoxal phosphate enzyme [Echinicola pacifica]|uniref:Pyridoxal phosphate homeostasis protein n=1 Tax=Echinicola pacifica TaxID=346377 RepID=A0A918PZH7_9BACT|nr:YggS family pyridoxal phosphate-dependent enzyme [Echinicola pacifica]GGZ27555.1 YggS family pyridoxal phosphate enzyme [Echinicola pacifica]